mgnify:CR=1 FL=1
MKGKIMRLKLLCGLSALMFGVSLTARAQEKTAQEALREQYSKNREQIEMIFKRKIEKISQSKALPEKMRNLLVRQADEMREFDIYTQDRKLEMKMRQMSERDKIKNELKQELYQKEAQLEEQKQADAAQEAALTPLEKSVAPTEEKADEKAAAAPAAPVEEKADEKIAAVVIEQVKTTVVEPVEAVAAPAAPVEEKADEKVVAPVAPAASVDVSAPLSEKAAGVMKQMKEQAASAPADEAVAAPATLDAVPAAPVVIEEVKTVVVPVVETAAPAEEKAIEKTLAPVTASAPAVEEKTDEKVDAVPAALDAVPAAPLDDGVKELGGGLEREL